ncbi:fatty-acid amide hydrolase 2-B-like isoform X2 [Ceratina calcarata]|uniref:Fatty-acid amide hydrolase 2-B-like isoform X2 n=1 Tax=Ceratina calcarata TaxID=156304 RepID=A0AAJ7S764_9HYME|nr:fatty-acid amide hydrolase 2-B-like isoform X2 [Ceratina calcarata]
MEDTVILIVQKIVKFILFLLSCLLTPFLMLQGLRKRNKLPLIKSRLLLLSASEIARKIRRQEVSSEEVVRAYIERCNDVNRSLNAIVESRFDAAVQEARNVDKFLAVVARTEEQLARDLPLLGVPVTVKESIAVEGMSNAVGVKKRKSLKANRNAQVVDMIREAGAIILLVSNTPELCLFWESNNKTTGPTWNPYDTTRVSGGSSGGEAALLGSAASCLSLASDIAGSARLPAMFCGVFGHKPTACLVPCRGHRPDSNDTNWPQYFTIGTMVRYAEDLPLVMKIISKPEESRCRFDQKVSPRNMKFYYLDDCCGMTNSIDDDMKQAIQRLRMHIETAYGLKVQKAQFSQMKFAFEIGAYLLLHLEVDGVNQDVTCAGSSKALLELLKCIFHASSYSLPVIAYSLLKWIFSKFPQSVRDAMAEKRISLKREFEELLGDDGVLIFPSFASASHYQYQAYAKVADFTYMMIYNVLGLPVTQCPMGLNKRGLPVGIQIVANAGNDHLTIAVAREIERVFGGWQQPPANESQV